MSGTRRSRAARETFHERHVLGQDPSALADLDPDRVQPSPRERELTAHVTAARGLHVEDQLPAAVRRRAELGSDDVGQVVLGAVDRPARIAVEHFGHLRPQLDPVERRHEHGELGLGDGDGRGRHRERGRVRCNGRLGCRG